MSPTTRNEFIELYKLHGRGLNKMNPEEQQPKENKAKASFYLKCIAGLALFGGIALFVAGFLVTQPYLVDMGATVAAVAVVTLFGLFSPSSSKREQVEANARHGMYDV